MGVCGQEHARRKLEEGPHLSAKWSFVRSHHETNFLQSVLCSVAKETGARCVQCFDNNRTHETSGALGHIVSDMGVCHTHPYRSQSHTLCDGRYGVQAAGCRGGLDYLQAMKNGKRGLP